MRQSLKILFALLGGVMFSSAIHAQTEMDAVMMNKKQMCIGPMYTYSSWDHYWEGKFKRNNLNLGTVSAQSVMLGANYGITDNLNVMVMAPYVWTKASAGTLRGMEGVQDISAFVKYRYIPFKKGNHKVSLFALGGISTPLTDYVADFLPLSIGMGTTNVTGKLMADYQWKKITVTASAAYIWRSNVDIDRSSYYDTQLRLTNEVKMPDMMQYHVRAGYRGKYLLAEAVFTRMVTLGGNDITKNNMPSLNNRMNASIVGAQFKYHMPFHPNLALMGGAGYTVDGRNVGQSFSINGGIFYFFYIGKRQTPNS